MFKVSASLELSTLQALFFAKTNVYLIRSDYPLHSFCRDMDGTLTKVGLAVCPRYTCSAVLARLAEAK